MNDTLKQFLFFIAPIMIAQLTTHLGEWLQQISPWLDARGMLVKRLLVAALAFGLTHLATVLGNLTLHTDINQLLGGNVGAVDPTDIGALLTAGLAYYFHQSAKTKPAQ